MGNFEDIEVFEYTRIVRQTENAWLLEIKDEEDYKWFSKQYCKLQANSLKINVPNWLAKKMELL